MLKMLSNFLENLLAMKNEAINCIVMLYVRGSSCSVNFVSIVVRWQYFRMGRVCVSSIGEWETSHGTSIIVVHGK